MISKSSNRTMVDHITRNGQDVEGTSYQMILSISDDPQVSIRDRLCAL